MHVYWELVVLLNFLVDLMLLQGTNRLSGFPPGWKRVISGAVLGGVYGGLCLLPELSFLGGTLWRLVFLGLMGVTAFGLDRSAIRRCGLFLLLSMALGGVAVNLGDRGYIGLLVAAALVWLLCHVSFGGTMPGKEYVPMEIHLGEKHIRIPALRDTGNTLRDPITGEQVLVIDSEAAAEITGLNAAELADPLATMGKLPGLRLIPYRTVGSSGGMLLAMRLSDVRIDKWRGSAVVAFAPQAIGGGEGYRALIGGAMG